MTTSPGPCGACAKFHLVGVDEKLAAAGFGACEERTLCHLMSEKAACAFTTSRFVARDLFSAPAPEKADDLPEEIDFGQ